MTRVRLFSAASLAVLAAVACSGSDSATDPASVPSYSQDEQGYLGAHVHKMPIKSQAQEAHAAKPGGGGTANAGIYYHGGPVLAGGTNVVAIYWSSGSTPIYANGPTPGSGKGIPGADGSLVGHFLRNLGGSDYWRINTTYTGGNGSAVTEAVTYRGYYADAQNAPTGTTNVSDAEIQAEIERAMIQYPNDGKTIYIVFSAGSVNLGGGFGTRYCAYHGNFASSHGDALFAVQPYDAAYPSSCTSGLAPANGDPGADAEVSTLAHEIEEAASDPDLNAWFDRRGYENADKCAWTWGNTFPTSKGVANVTLNGVSFLIQRNWINYGSGGCYLGKRSNGSLVS